MAAGSGLTSVSGRGGKEFSGEEEVGEGDCTGAESERVWKDGGLRRVQELVCCLLRPRVWKPTCICVTWREKSECACVSVHVCVCMCACACVSVHV